MRSELPTSASKSTSAAAPEAVSKSANPLLAEWRTPFAVPPFADIRDAHFEPAFDTAMAEQKREMAAILASREAPTFANTIEALERSGKSLKRVAKVFFGLNGSHSSDGIRALARRMAPRMSAHRDDILLDRKLFERVKAVHDHRHDLELGAEQKKLLEETFKDFVRNGVNLDDDSQARLREINGELAELGQRFGQNLLAEVKDFELHVASREDLGALPENLISAAAEEARRRGHDSGWSFTATRPSAHPFLQYSPNRALRKRLLEVFARRGGGGNDLDNNVDLARIAALRAEQARLLGYDTHAHFVLSDNMAENPERVYDLLDKMWRPALAVAKSERQALRAMMHEDGVDDDLKAWDWRYYAERLRQSRYDLDEEALRPYFELTAVRDGAFMLANRLYGLEFTEVADVPTWHPDQQAFEVKDASGRHQGLLYMDFFARESKRGGAWMNSLRTQSKVDGEVRPIVTTTFNFPPPGDAPSQLSFREAETVFHEFGHALHDLLSDVTYASLSGTSVPRDFVEFPSQVLENWLREPEVLRLVARHGKTGVAIPDELIAKMKAAERLGQGFATVEYLAACYLDMAWHTLSEAPDLDPEAFERREMERIGLIGEILPRYRSTYFRHAFGGGYSAGYYSYIWAAVLDADGFQAFRETSLFDAETAGKLRHLLSQGGTRHGMELYREFRGRDPEIGPLLEQRGFNGAGQPT